MAGHGHTHAGHSHGAHSHGSHGHGSHGHGGHAHGGHGHVPKNFGRAFAIGIALNAAFVVIEAGYGYSSNAMSLVADAGHNLSDVLGLVAAWIATRLVERRASARFTYGYRGSSILAALFNAVFLLIAMGAVIWEAIVRLLHPEPVAGATVMVVAAVGIAVNGLTAWLFSKGAEGDINIRGAFLHMMADAAVSAGVGDRGPDHPLDGARMDRSPGQPRHRGPRRLGDLGPPARQRGDVAGRRAAGDLPRSRGRVS